MDKSKSEKTNKYAAVILYAVALICLLLGLFLPLTSGNEILALQLPEAFNAVSGAQNSFILAYPVNFLGFGSTVDIMAWIVIIYVVITALALIGLIPVLASGKSSKTARVIAYIIESAAAATLSVYAILLTEKVVVDATTLKPAVAETSFLSYAMLIALGGTLLALILQCLIYKKGTGFLKFVLFILSVVSVFALFDLAVLIPTMHRTWANIADSLKSSSVFYGETTGISFLKLLIEGNADGNGILTAVGAAATVKEKVAIIISAIVAALVVLNYFLDLIGLSTNAKKVGLNFNIFRYLLEIAAVIALFITLAVCKVAPGLLLYIVTIALVVQIIISIIRRAVYSKRSVKAKLYTDEKPVTAVYDNAQPEEDTVLLPAPAAEAAPIEQSQKKESITADVPVAETRVYTVNAVYQGPTDEFMRKLTNDEKIEFAMTFIEKSKGDLGNIPDYVIGGNNKKFFSAVFIYLGKVRSLISDGLLNKMYKELNML